MNAKALARNSPPSPMQRPRFDSRSLAAIVLPAGTNQLILRDDRVAGLGYRITPGSRRWILEGRVRPKNGAPVKRRLVLCPGTVLVAEARRLANAELAKWHKGHDPIAARQANAAASLTLRDAFAHLVAHRALKPGTVADYDRKLRSGFPDWSTKPVAAITRADVQARYAELIERANGGSAFANAAMRVLRLTFGYVVGSRIAALPDGNPTAVLRDTGAWRKPRRRQSVVKADQLASLFAVLSDFAAPPASATPNSARRHAARAALSTAFRLMLLTGLRPGEVQKLRPVDFDPRARTLKIADAKTASGNRAQPLGPVAVALLRDHAAAGPLMFGKLSGRAWRDLVAALDAEGIQLEALNDPRRTFISAAASLPISDVNRRRLAGHATAADAHSGYAVGFGDELHRAAELVEKTIMEHARKPR